MTSQAAKRAALHMWLKDGEAEHVAGDPTSVGRSWYESRAEEVVSALKELGYSVTKLRAKASRAGAGSAR